MSVMVTRCYCCAIWCSEFFIVFHGSWQGFESQKLLDEQLLDKSNVLPFVTKDAGLVLAARRRVQSISRAEVLCWALSVK